MRHLKPRDTIGIRGPFGSAWPVEEAVGRDCVIVTGGIGLAPLRPVLYHVIAHREKFRRIVLLYGARSPEEILFRHELEGWRSKFDLDVRVTVDRAGSDWRGTVGVVPMLIRRAEFDPGKTTAMVCGPEVMMRFTVRELESRGIEQGNIYVSMERNMKCALGFCGHCQYGPAFVCKDGPVFRFDRIAAIFGKAEI
jgi:NAD(P)H-flavin reductase